MSTDRSRDALARFHDFLGEKGLMSPSTAQTRKVSSLKLLSILDEDECKDVTSVDIDDVVRRFNNLHGQEYNPDSLVTYRSRLRSAIADFRSYLENPLSFRSRVQSRDVSSRAKKDSGDPSNNVKTEIKQAEQARPHVTPVMPGANVMPIPLRADLTVLIHGLPHNLTQSEARKLSGVINALAIPD